MQNLYVGQLLSVCDTLLVRMKFSDCLMCYSEAIVSTHTHTHTPNLQTAVPAVQCVIFYAESKANFNF
jgi:hypothetical protein